METKTDKKGTMKENELRELDEWIAENVFGWRPYKKRTDATWVHPPGHHASFGAWPRYTTDRAAAMEVLEKCVERCDAFETGLSMYIHPDGFAICCDLTNDIDAETLPLAICLFAQHLFKKD